MKVFAAFVYMCCIMQGTSNRCCYRFVWQGFGGGGAIGVASVRS